MSLSSPNRAQSFGRYELLERVSAGGMAEVFRARDTETGAIVALKRILPQIAEDDEFIRMFEDEARIASQLEHPHIARTLDFGHVDGAYYIAFEFVDGRDMRAVFDRAVRLREPLPLPFLLYVFTRIGEGLSYAHARKDSHGTPQSIVHRDVSPQNLVVSFDGDVKLIDFGIAKAAGKVSRTQVGTLKGKFGYMAPEQIRGMGDVDQRADVFTLGICMWELLTLERLFNADNELLVLEKVRSAPILPPSKIARDIPAELDRIVLKALAKDLNERYRAAKDLYRDLDRFSQSVSAVASRDEVARYMRRAFPESLSRRASQSDAEQAVAMNVGSTSGRGNSRSADQENRAMAADSTSNKGSDLDIFEGLGKKGPASSARPSAPPPAPPRNSQPPQIVKSSDLANAKKTLIGMTPGMGAMTPQPGSIRVPAPPARTNPPPPPGRGSLPQVVPPPARAGSAAPPPPMSTRPAPSAAASATPAGVPAAASPPKHASSGQGHLDMDWDDEDEATHIFDKAPEEHPKSNAPRPAAGTPLAPPVAASPSFRPAQTLMGMNGGGFVAPPPPPPSVQRASAPPPPPSVQRPSAPPPPPSAGAFMRNSSVPAAPGPSFPHAGPPTIDPTPPPPYGGMAPQVATAPMPMPGQRPPSAAPPSFEGGIGAAPVYPSAPPPSSQMSPSMVARMEATALVRPPSSGRMGLIGTGVVFAALAAGLVVFLMMPRTGRIAVNVSDATGGSVNHVEIFVDGKKQCDTSPCIVDQVSTGVHQVKVLATGYDPPADRAVTVESRKDATIDFSMTSGGAKSGTGIKVAGSQTGVRLFVDGKEIGPLPQELHDLTPGDHSIRLAGSDRYAPIDKKIILAKDELQDLGDQTLKVVKGKATITLGTPGAKVSIVSGSDRREFPTLPIAVDLDTSKPWALEASKPGFQDYKQPVSFDDGQAEKTFNIVLDAKSQPVAVAANNNSGGGSYSPPASAPKWAAPPTPKPAPASAPASSDDSSSGGGESFLNINSIPASSIVLDGKPVGNTPKVHVSVSPGPHTVLFVNSDEGLKKQITVNVGAGETKPAIAKLRE